ncbi:S-layer protein [Planctomycetaceae bacterium SCGC AG-212-F19]|nr:S-layer protein [Planctomycetaceae bacterium SCGC AG-212-F19]
MRKTSTVAALCLLTFGVSALAAAPESKGLGDPGALKAIVIDTGPAKQGAFVLVGREASQQLLVTGQYATGQVRDLTRRVSYEAVPNDIVAIEATGLVTPLKEGEATITVKSADGLTATTKVRVANLDADVRYHFANQIVPIFTKVGCNTGGCHGKASGQNGFKLSLFGFEPTEDYEYLVKEARGRRLFPAAPAHSLLLLKATGTMAHGGGKRLPIDSPFYRTILRWIEQGAPNTRTGDPIVTHIEVLPTERLMERGTQQQLVVVAHLSDGSTMDVTRLAQYESNNTDMAVVAETGLVGIQKLPGSVAVMTRFQEHVAVFRATVPLGAPVTNLPPAKNFIDELVFKELKKLGLPPSDLADDGSFIRRATIDITGRLPTKEETEQFSADKDAGKYEKLIDRLLDSKEYADYFANKWGAILRNRRKAANEDAKPTVAFHDWIRNSLAANKPYDQFVREILTATGKEIEVPPVIWYREVKETTAQMEDAAQLFMGQRLACARCHHHPLEKWSQQDYWGLTAFFARVTIKDPPPPKAKGKNQPAEPKEPFSVSHNPGTAQAINPKTNQAVKPTPLSGPAVDVDKDADPRARLADWMAEKENPFFAKALGNRYWKHFFGRGLVDPEDDLRLTNPASNPELLEALAKSFVESNYDLKKLVRTICTANVYRLGAVPNEYNADDKQNISRYIPKRLNAEVLLDALDDVTLARSIFKGVPAGTRAVQLPDNQVESYFLSVFGRPDSSSACECERSSDASLAQALHLFNSTELLTKVAGPRAKALAADKRPHEERIKDLYLVALSREPSKEETANLLAHIEKKKTNVQQAYEDILWALVNTKEFLFNH